VDVVDAEDVDEGHLEVEEDLEDVEGVVDF
jgi:hypothetical protein